MPYVPLNSPLLCQLKPFTFVVIVIVVISKHFHLDVYPSQRTAPEGKPTPEERMEKQDINLTSWVYSFIVWSDFMRRKCMLLEERIAGGVSDVL